MSDYGRSAKRMAVTHPVMKRVRLTPADVGKIFVVNEGESGYQILDRSAFLALPLEDIGRWTDIDADDLI